ncbi:hypothetical protein ABPG74_019855 [Tetrahymena malaccensis]
MKAFALIALIALNVVQCANNQYPPWSDGYSQMEYNLCLQSVVPPICAMNGGPCTSAYQAYQNCDCSSSQNTFQTYQSCVQNCGTTFLNDPTVKDDNTASTCVNKNNQCVFALKSNSVNGYLLTLPAFLLAVFALLF